MKILFSSFLITVIIIQEDNPWRLLADVDFKIKKSKLGYEIPYPVFGQKVLSLDGRSIRLKGYIIPLEEVGEQNYFMFSSLPFSSCFFCGGAGPETVIEVYSTKPIKYTENLIQIEGILELNSDDPDHHMYILKNASQK